jgi:quercetin 2,3-dioxygenase
MLTLRRSAERGHANHGWLDSHHSFSFADYYDPAHMGFRSLRVINEDRVQPGAGFPTHAHQDMEIITYVLAGALEHKDSLGNGSIIRPGDVQRMSAGTGVRHSEFNHSRTEVVHFLQIWILPVRARLQPSYEQKHFAEADLRGTLRLIASPDARAESVTVHQDASIYATRLAPNDSARHRLAPGRAAYIHVAKGALTLNGQTLAAGDGAAITAAGDIELTANAPAEALLFDLG